MKRLKKALLRNLLVIVAIVGAIAILILSRTELSETARLLANIKLPLIVLLPVVQLASYFFISCYYRVFLTTFGKKISNWRVFGTTIALNFVNQILPSGGASGITYLLYAYKDVAPAGQITLIQLGRYTLAFISYIPLLIIGFIWLNLSGSSSLQLNLAYGVAFVVVSAGLVLLLVAVSNQNQVNRFVAVILKIINRIVGLFRRRADDFIEISKTSGFIKEFNDGAAFLRKQGRHLVWPLLFMQLSTIAEIAVVYIAFWLLGVDIHPAVVLIAFTWANVVGVISIIPGDIGTHELTVITLLSFVGVGKENAIAGTLIYRVFNKLITVAIGFICYLIFLKPLIKNVNRQSNL